MANEDGSGGAPALQVSGCSCETARDRYNLSKNMRIEFEHMAPFFINDDLSDEEEDAGLLGDDLAQVEAEIQEAVLQLQNGDADEHLGEDILFDNELADQVDAALQEAEHLLQTDDDDDDGEDQDQDQDNNMDDAEGIGEFLVTPMNIAAMEDSESDEDLEMEDEWDNPPSEPDTEAHHRVPSIARWRLNLTALSQRYNIYFAAYRDKIHVSRPRSCVSHNLPSMPDLILKPGASEAARSVGGTLDPTIPHQINHMIVGDLGVEEILLMAYDDGDVIAFYTRVIEEEITRHERRSHSRAFVPRIRPFFHENVKISAWGLAIHTKSRIIAVGTNLHAVTVFIPALTGCPFEPAHGDPSDPYYTIRRNVFGHTEPGNIQLRENSFENESWMRQRDASWMLTLDTRPQGDNIPNVTFSNDRDGNADKVVAIDVKGNIWLIPIWSFDIPAQKIPPLHRSLPNRLPGDIGRPRGWGVLVIHGSSFLPTVDIHDSLGLGRDEIRHATHPDIGKWLDITGGVRSIPHNSTQHPWARARQRERLASDELNRLIHNEWWFSDYLTESAQWQMTIPSDQRALVMKSVVALKRRTPVKGHESTEQGMPVLGDGASILRLYETDIELRSQDEGGVGIVMQHATKQIQPRPPGLPALRWAHERLSNNHYIPELSLVVAGSMCGRVALITLTHNEHDNLAFRRGFKIEAILPTKEDEDSSLRPICPLFGVATGPLPVDGKPDDRSPPRPRRYRIMIQYYDQRILSYEISRGAESDALMIT